MDHRIETDDPTSKLKVAIAATQALAREQLIAVWQLHVDRVREQLEAGWHEQIDQIFEERFSDITTSQYQQWKHHYTVRRGRNILPENRNTKIKIAAWAAAWSYWLITKL